MGTFLYNVLLLCAGLLLLPKFAWQCLIHGKYRSTLMARLGLRLPTYRGERASQTIWMHAVSLGEVKAMAALFEQIRARFPHRPVVISTTTETGLAEARRALPDAQAHFILPLDFSWIMSRLVSQICPAYLILCESDFWYHLLTEAKTLGARIALVNGKMSQRSCARFRRFPFFSKPLFATFDLLCLQNAEYFPRFLAMGIIPSKLHNVGNLKLQASTHPLTPAEREHLRSLLQITESSRVLVIGSTHEKEEELLLDALTPLWKRWPDLILLLAPRHPERFDAVASLCHKKKYPYARLSKARSFPAPLVLIDTMGQLASCYQIAHLALVAGSYVPHVGGHNIYEPVQQGTPVFFGPYMHQQRELKDLVLSAHAGKQVPLEQLQQEVIAFFESPSEQKRYRAACHQLSHSHQGALQKTFDLLFP